MKETIVAVTTPPGQGGVSIIRVSGPCAYVIGTKLTSIELTARKAIFCKIKDLDNTILDDAIVIYFPAPHSFTGEDIVEFQCHGSPILLDLILNNCIKLGASIAKPGEFSLTAFLNGKIDLIQAEAIADLIAASSIEAVKMSQRSLQGDFSVLIKSLTQDLIKLRVIVESAIDFSDEEIEFLKDLQILANLEKLHWQIDNIILKAKQGSLMQEGCHLVIVGEPNVGKSTLLNALSGREVAIVTHIPGTTRDLMKERILIEGLPFILVDTAGLRVTDCPIEQEGIKRAKNALSQADLLIWLIDVNNSNYNSLENLLENRSINSTKILKVFNKIDAYKQILKKDDAIYISAKTGEGMEHLRQEMLKNAGYNKNEGLFIARRRHVTALETTKEHIMLAIEKLKTMKNLELIAEELRQAQFPLNTITGEFSSEDLLGEIFSTFCIGK